MSGERPMDPELAARLRASTRNMLANTEMETAVVQSLQFRTECAAAIEAAEKFEKAVRAKDYRAITVALADMRTHVSRVSALNDACVAASSRMADYDSP